MCIKNQSLNHVRTTKYKESKIADNIEEFVEEFSGAPYELHELADEAIGIEDCDELALAAQRYLDAKFAFEQALEEQGVEIG